ncbi:hypothetical protein SUNI508_05215 [Seiridium unicorne]|uniref:Transcription factor Pcc1 n=1 Tax=Seiridium unicorne TaxID=138068 RepID=A0ABR2V4S4_9PEZI
MAKLGKYNGVASLVVLCRCEVYYGCARKDGDDTGCAEADEAALGQLWALQNKQLAAVNNGPDAPGQRRQMRRREGVGHWWFALRQKMRNRRYRTAVILARPPVCYKAPGRALVNAVVTATTATAAPEKPGERDPTYPAPPVVQALKPCQPVPEASSQSAAFQTASHGKRNSKLGHPPLDPTITNRGNNPSRRRNWQPGKTSGRISGHQSEHGRYERRPRVSMFFVSVSAPAAVSNLSMLTTFGRTLDVPFPTARLASVALRSLRVDKELSPLVQRELAIATPTTGPENGRIQDSLLKVTYKATTNRMLRVAVNGFMESLTLVLEVMENLDTDVLSTDPTDAI